jgi:RecA/RadA recombinase
VITRRPIGQQIVEHSAKKPPRRPEYDGTSRTVSTGSTLLDLAISGGRFAAGGIPGGILVEIFGPAASGKTVLLCEIAGNVQRQQGQILFFDPEARLNKQFARLFGFTVAAIKYETPDTISQLFKPIREWEPAQNGATHAVFADSLAALSTEQEMDDKDQYGMRRAKEFSEQCRLTCRVLAHKGILMVCSNQVRQNLDAGPYGQKYRSPGGEAIGFYSSLRLRCSSPMKIKRKRKIAGKDVAKIIGIETEVEVFKSSVWQPYNSAPVSIIYDYGIDDIRDSLQFLKTHHGTTIYQLGDQKLSKSLDEAIAMVETDQLMGKLKQETIDCWNTVREQFHVDRKPKQRGVMT